MRLNKDWMIIRVSNNGQDVGFFKSFGNQWHPGYFDSVDRAKIYKTKMGAERTVSKIKESYPDYKCELVRLGSLSWLSDLHFKS